MVFKKIVLTGVFLALCLILPFFTGQIPQIGSMLSPMHIPVFICGLVCGWPYAAIIGFIAPLLRHGMFYMPPLITAIAMAFELFAYGGFTALFSKILPKKPEYIYVSLILSMIFGRFVWGTARYIIALLTHSEFTIAAFISGAFITALPGIICHLIIVPLVVIAIRKSGVIND